jgi:hypothetical protein
MGWDHGLNAKDDWLGFLRCSSASVQIESKSPVFRSRSESARPLLCQGLPNRYVLANTASLKTANDAVGRTRIMPVLHWLLASVDSPNSATVAWD